MNLQQFTNILTFRKSFSILLLKGSSEAPGERCTSHSFEQGLCHRHMAGSYNSRVRRSSVMYRKRENRGLRLYNMVLKIVFGWSCVMKSLATEVNRFMIDWNGAWILSIMKSFHFGSLRFLLFFLSALWHIHSILASNKGKLYYHGLPLNIFCLRAYWKDSRGKFLV